MSGNRPTLAFTLKVALLILGAVLSLVGWMITRQTALLLEQGVAGRATVTDLRTFQSTSGNSRSTTYRVFMAVDGKSLSDDVSREVWESLTIGGSVGLQYVPGDSGVCMIGERSHVEEVSRWAHAALYAGLPCLLAGVLLSVLPSGLFRRKPSAAGDPFSIADHPNPYRDLAQPPRPC